MRNSIGLTLTSLACAVALAACDVEQTEEGEMPEIDMSYQEGEMPEYDVDTADVSVGTEEATIEVPDVDVSMEEEQVTVPDVDIDMPDDDEIEE